MDYLTDIYEFQKQDILKPNIHQITIDIIQQADHIMDFEEEHTLMRLRESIGAFSYRVGIILEVMNPEFTLDIKLLTELEAILDKHCKYLQEQLKRQWEAENN